MLIFRAENIQVPLKWIYKKNVQPSSNTIQHLKERQANPIISDFFVGVILLRWLGCLSINCEEYVM
jgi:hypothetical protein